ncbi:conserved hypothetical protein [Theileria orientalis strain Shintoku]|uniref:Uncharacterized protein n=1 Tax=Theileria orientalis strain Shintoku TaxID=869250 RepID=J4DPE5_THEOR|nr:conserved hypothetical protein [Theileria orientalis strain Shintoku]BAM40564.1 conserved hypothetical protein [Theileria orientalis strain Shintoku]|eukprot:XP_009690865.1 conserved hypothetical protein [Theileria orientalis strain Shintoku]
MPPSPVESRRFLSGSIAMDVVSGRSTLSHTRNSGKNDGHFGDSKLTHRRPNDSNNRLRPDFDPQPKFYYSDYSDVDAAPSFNFNLISLDITKPGSTKEIEYNYNPITGADIFEIKRPNLLRKVTERERLLWESKHGKYSDKIIAFKDERGENRLKVFIADDVNMKQRPRLALPVRVPGIGKDAPGGKDASGGPGGGPRGSPAGSEREGGSSRDEFIVLSKESTDRRAASKRHEENLRSKRVSPDSRFRDDHRYRSPRGYGFRHFDDYRRYDDHRHYKPRHDRLREFEKKRRPHKSEYIPGDLFLLFASKEATKKKFDLMVNGQTERYQFKPEAQCVRVRVDDHILWKHRHGHPFPSGLEFDKREGMVLLQFPEFTDVYINAEGVWYYRI